MIAIAFASGAVVGSLLSACIRDLPHRRAITWPRRDPRWPIVELAAATMCAGAFWFYGPTLLFVSRVVLGSALIVLCATDYNHRLLPNAVTLPGIAIGFAFSFVTPPGWWSSFIGIAVGGGLPLLTAEVYYRVRGIEGLGMGDVKMLAMIGAFLGWQATLITLMVASISGSIAGTILLLRGADMKHTLPFGIFLAAGAAIAAVFAPSLLEWWVRAQQLG
jgi:leader peptidase (prepilin peptidase) / N-methyltransferase